MRTAPPRVLMVWCPDWPVTAVGADAGTPAAVLEQSRVAACSAAARAAGVRRGQRVRDAQRHCPELEVHARDPDAEGRLFETVAAAVAEVTPWVEVVRPGVCAIPVRGAARYYGGEESLRVHVQDTVIERGFDCGAGVADGLFAAELAARADGGLVVPAGEGAAYLAPYPVSVLGRPDLADLLRRLGVRTLGAFAALPAADVTGRFGAGDVAAHRLARGLDARPLAPRRPAADLRVTTEFEPPAQAAEQVIFAAKALAGRLHEILAAEGLTCVRLRAEVTGADGRRLTRLWRHEGTLSTLAIAERIRWQLSSWSQAGDQEPDAQEVAGEEGVGGVVRLLLAPDQLVPDEGRQQALWGQVSLDDRITRAAARIQAMLGHAAVTRPYRTGGRGPGERAVRVPIGDLPPERSGGGDWPAHVPAPLPATVRPRPAEVTDAHGSPVLVNERCAVSAPPAVLSIDGDPAQPVTAWAGPWPARERWWDLGRARRRARFQVLTSGDHAYLLAFEGGRWQVEGGYE